MSDQNEEIVFEVASRKKAGLKPSAALGVAAGVAAAAAGTALWALVATKILAPWMSLFVAAGLAFSMRALAKSKAFLYGILGIVLAIMSVLAGHMITIISIVSKHGGRSPSEIIAKLDLATISDLAGAFTRPIDVLMYVGAIAIAFWFSFEHPKQQLPE